MTKPRIYVLVGPTAVGKTAVSIQLAHNMGAEIISADSMQVYRGLDIGSAKPSIVERDGIPHHVLDVVEIDNADFSAARFQSLAAEAIADIQARGHPALVVGGTGLYIHALTHPLQFTQVSKDETVRAALQLQEQNDPGSVYRQLQQIDPLSAARLHPNDLKRVTRAVEVYLVSGRTITSFGADFANALHTESPYDAIIAGLTMERASLYARIDRRVDTMLRDGLLDEVQRLHEKGYDRTLPALQGLGYKQLLRYCNGEIQYEKAIEDIKRETRRFAKRQWTWFKRDSRIRWFDTTGNANIAELTQRIQRYYNQADEERNEHA